MSDFTLGDFRKLLGQTKRLGPLPKIMSMLPGMGGMANMPQMLADAEGEIQRLGGIIDSMTQAERRNPSKLIDQSRRRRIAAGAGVEPHVVNDLVKQFDSMVAIMKEMSRTRFAAVNQNMPDFEALYKKKSEIDRRFFGGNQP